MKKRMLAALLLALLLAACAAHAQTLPSNAVFSPGLIRLAEKEGMGLPVHAEAEIDVDKAMYARDLSVLEKLLSGVTFVYDGASGSETLCIRKDGQMLGAYLLAENERLDAISARLAGTAVLERVPLAAVAAWLEGLKAGDQLAFGFAVAQPFALERTMSDDGTRLTKIRISGAVAKPGEAPWQVSGYLRQPAGRAPKDTFEITIAQDERNTVELLYSALRENEVTRKNREGTASVRTTLKLAGKLAGYGVSSRLNVTMKNRWTADGEKLSERVSVTSSLTHQDNTPGRRNLRLNSVEAENKHTIRITTREGEDDPIELTDEITLSVTMDSNTVLNAGADVRLRAGGEALTVQHAEAITPQTVQMLAAACYALLDEDTKSTINKGLPAPNSRGYR